MGQITLVTGGARSGKSAHAERLTRAHSGTPIYIATSEPRDDEMRERIDLHVKRRGDDWVTVEERRELARVLRETDGQGPRLVDCLTLWLTNEMFAEGGDWRAGLDAICEALRSQSSPVVLVTNEVGSGIVPEDAMTRAWRDAAGAMNQRVGDVADRVVLVVAGQALTIKGG